jgi:NADH-quinone oxidoreductase subunit I
MALDTGSRGGAYDPELREQRRTLPGLGLLKGLGVTLKTMLTPAVTQQYPHEKPDLHPRTRGVIALMEENCTVCMLCAKECPDWCIYIESHKETIPTEPGGRTRTRNTLDRFAIDFALCMYCGICVEVCPFDALFWSPEFEYSTFTIGELLHEKGKLREWMDTVPPPPPLEEGAEPPMEVAKALQKVEQEREKAREAAAQQAQKVAKKTAGAPAKGRAPADEEIEVEAEVDQEVYDQLIAEGKSDRVARARAKAAYVRREKARIRAEREQQASEEPEETPADEAAAAEEPEAAAAPAPAEGPPEEEPELDIEPGEIDQEVYDQLIAEGKSERVARARAKAAAVRKAKQRARERDGQ